LRPFLIVLVAALQTQSFPPPETTTATLSASVYDASGTIVNDLRPEELTVAEKGQKRVVKRVVRDPRPLALAVLMDTSDTLGRGVMMELADSVMDFIQGLPAEIDARLLTIGTPPEWVNLDAPPLVRRRLRARIPFGKLSLYDGIAEAADQLAQEKRSRHALVIVTSSAFSEDDRDKAFHAVGSPAPIVLVVQFGGSGQYGSGLDSIVKWSGGRYQQIGAASGVRATLKQLQRELDAPWLVFYRTPSAAEMRHVEVGVARKGAKVRFRPTGLK
jgi:hypothetical protein